MRARPLLIALTLAALAACTSQVSAPAAPAAPAPQQRSAPMPPPGPEPTSAGIAYAPASAEGSTGRLLDLYIPENARAPLPVVIWTGGSAWMAENGRESARPVAQALNPAGYAVAGVSIRSSTSAPFPAQVHDIKAAIRWLRANAQAHGLDPERIAVMGDSSGGWTAAMAALTGDAPGLEGDAGVTGVSSAVRAAVAFYPPTNFLEMDAHAIGGCVNGASTSGAFCHDGADSPESRLVGCAIQTCPDAVQAANPINYISRSDPPLLILHGERDRLVPFQQGRALFEALRAACHDATFIALPNADHGPFFGFVSNDSIRGGAMEQRSRSEGCTHTQAAPVVPTWDMVVAFLDRTVKN